MKVRRVVALSTGISVGAFVHSGEPFGLDRLGRELREQTDTIVLAVERYGDGWLVSYREAAERGHLETAS